MQGCPSPSSRKAWVPFTSHWVIGPDGIGHEYRSYHDDDEKYPGIASVGFSPCGTLGPVWVTTPPAPNKGKIGDFLPLTTPLDTRKHVYATFKLNEYETAAGNRFKKKHLLPHIASGELWGGLKITAVPFNRNLPWDHKYGGNDWSCSRMRSCVPLQNSNNVEIKRKRNSSPGFATRNEYLESCLHSADGSGYVVELDEEK